MLRKLVRFALHQPLFLFLILALFIGAGVYSFKTLSIEAFPDVTDVQAPVITLFPGHAPEEVEKQITIPLEIELVGLPNAIRMFSDSGSIVCRVAKKGRYLFSSLVILSLISKTLINSR